jgi:ribosomal protein S18 acetylase RimI-like enzyme
MAQVPVVDIVRALNAAYADYYVPIYLTPHTFHEMAAREDIRLAASVAALADDRVVGMGLLGVRGERAWIAGVGVIPGWRRQGIGRQVMLGLIDQARGNGVRRVQLEVITRNEAAHTLYRSLGFQDRRRLLILFTGKSVNGVPHPPADPALTVAEESPAELLEAIGGLIGQELPWQHDLASIEDIVTQVDGLAARDNLGGLAGACLWSGDGSQAGVLSLTGRSPQIGAELLAALRERLPEARLAYLNVPDDDPMLPALLEAGFAETLTQSEMTLDLSEETRSC